MSGFPGRLRIQLSRASMAHRHWTGLNWRHHITPRPGRRLRHKDLQASQVIPSESNMREPTLVHPDNDEPRKVDIAKQVHVNRYHGMIGLERIRTNLALNRPGGGGGTNFSRLVDLISHGTSCTPRTCSMQSCGMPFHNVHQDAGHLNNWANAAFIWFWES